MTDTTEPKPADDKAMSEQIKPVALKVTDEMAFTFHRALSDGALSADDLDEIKAGLAPVVEQLNEHYAETVQQLQQRIDRLLAALKDARDWIDKNNFGGCDTFALLEKIDAIIAEAEQKV